ncbi:NADH-quinone oxidoreductase subunit C [Mangrovibacterium lignilyticum]|uniref:NADH-quinone oxidoreductase subunit C n=1 Tax=Mangrovibacterium lignilyticum TaxID=2668052 RepID=UPI0013D347C8|nr:NADH-quinone oxidoreductase subunit C [Mangrovibacterium lignilyticum]
MQKLELLAELQKHFPEAEFPENTQLTEMVISKDKIHEVAAVLKADETLAFDYLISQTAVDWKEKMTLVYHLESVKHRHTLVLKADVADRENPQVETVSDIWPTAIPHECEVFDLFGIRFNNHPALRRLFLEDDYGYPLRKDFRDEVNFIER